MIPALGLIVIYNTTEAERNEMEAVNKAKGKQMCNIQQQLPALIVAVWNNEGEPATEGTVVNLQVMMDGHGCIWKTSVHQGNEPGQWMEPKRS